MSNYKLTNEAVNDLSEIWDYTFDKWSETQADKYYQNLMSYFKELANNPYIGKSYSGILSNILAFKVKRHIIFYRQIGKNNIEIIRILHERMDIKSRLS